MTATAVPSRAVWLTPEQAAASAQVHPATIYRAIAAGKLQAVKPFGGNIWRIRRDAFDQFMQGR